MYFLFLLLAFPYEQLHAVSSELDLQVEPEDASVYLDGKEVKVMPMQLDLDKSYALSVTHKDYLPEIRTIVVNYPGKTEELIVLSPKISILELTVYPSDSVIEIDGEAMKPIKGRLHLTAGKKHIKISHADFFDHEEIVDIGPNKSFTLDTVYLKADSDLISPSEKRLTLRLEWNPLHLQQRILYAQYIPVACFLEWKLLSIGGGFSTTDQKEEKKTEAGFTQKKINSRSDFYVTVRLISPRLGPFNLFASYTLGEFSENLKSFEEVSVLKKKVSYSGFGGGFRVYLNPKLSLQVEAFQLSKQNDSRVLAGAAYEF